MHSRRCHFSLLAAALDGGALEPVLSQKWSLAGDQDEDANQLPRNSYGFAELVPVAMTLEGGGKRMSTVTDSSGRTLLVRGKMTPDELRRHLAHQQACAAAARRPRMRRKGDGKGSRSQ